jgi:PIN domain nuclease of toxin-antitoxin system
VKLLLDTHLLVRAMGEPAWLGPALRELLEDPQHTLCFSVASLWELVIKAALGRGGVQVQPSVLRRTLLDGGFVGLPIEAAHVLAVAQLPPLHRDPLIACCWPRPKREGLLLLTADALLARYPGPVRHQGSF